MNKKELANIIQLISNSDNVSRELGVQLAISQGMTIKELSKLCIDNFCNVGQDNKTSFKYDYELGEYSIYTSATGWVLAYLGNTEEVLLEARIWVNKEKYPPTIKYFERLITNYLNDK